MNDVSLDSPAQSYVTRGGITVRRSEHIIRYHDAIEPLVDALDERRGVLLTSSFEYPGRYTRWDMGFVDPPIVLVAKGLTVEITALNSRGRVLLTGVMRGLEGVEGIESLALDDDSIRCSVAPSTDWFPEELRSKQPTVFTAIRAIIQCFHNDRETYLGLYGAFGYELTFQFDPIDLQLPREADQRDLVLYLPDEILIVDHRRERATRYCYEFGIEGQTTAGQPRTGQRSVYVPGVPPTNGCDHAPGEYAATVREAIKHFARGDLFEVVPGQTFFECCPAPPSEVFRRLRERNPAPYGALLNLGDSEFLVAASPEMFVRVEGRRIETCPISGTIARGDNAIGDSEQIRTLLNSRKEESELTMCTDVDRNDKSRVCEAGSIKVIGRRQIEMYSRLIHTVDHVEGTLREDFDALDGFLAHTWAVTVTGAPKRHAIQFIEDHERSPRRWYGGALGFVGFNGNMNTGLTLRTVRIKDGVAEVRAGATLLFESEPEAEEAETRLKASALLDAILRETTAKPGESTNLYSAPAAATKVLMVDHEDSFVHTLAGYFRETGAAVSTHRTGFPVSVFEDERPDLVLLSPGPGRPEDFNVSRTIDAALSANVPIFGVCLGLQGIVTYFGGSLRQLDTPLHGKPSRIKASGGVIFKDLPTDFTAGRYHSLYANAEDFPDCLRITAQSDDGLIMGIEHKTLPIAAVQFHPESILSLGGEYGRKLVANVVERLRRAA